MNHRPDSPATTSSDRAALAERGLPDEERMIDESVAASFPASDPPASSQPGNIVWQRYADAEAHRRTRANIRWWMGLATIAAGVACAVMLLGRRSRRSSR
jgi:hypothetical protein